MDKKWHSGEKYLSDSYRSILLLIENKLICALGNLHYKISREKIWTRIRRSVVRIPVQVQIFLLRSYNEHFILWVAWRLRILQHLTNPLVYESRPFSAIPITITCFQSSDDCSWIIKIQLIKLFFKILLLTVGIKPSYKISEHCP